MTGIFLNRVTVNFPIYNSRARSLRRQFLDRTINRRIASTANNHVSVIALEDISLNVQAGDRLGLVGRNGAGKSTLLRVMAGIYEPTVGRVAIDGSVSSLTDIMMGMDPEATGYENIILRSIFLGMTIKEARSQVTEIEAFTELGGFLNLPMRTYSTGMMLRLAFAVTTAVKPQILIMDEMIGAGDAAFSSKAQERLNRMIDNAHILVIASHDEGIMRRLCNKAALLQDGRLLGTGSIDQIFSAYHNLC